MQTQSTPVHVRLWHTDFWCLALAWFLLTASAYMLIPVLPPMADGFLPPATLALLMASYVPGLFVMGPLCNYLVQRFRRNHVCQAAVMAMLSCAAAVYLLRHSAWGLPHPPAFLLLRFFFSVGYGLGGMVLLSTLVTDVSESCFRTEANYSVAWTGRLAMAVGPVAGIAVQQAFAFEYVLLAIGACCLLAVLLIEKVKLPFRAPDDDVARLSSDRFFMASSWPLVLNLVMFTAAVGTVMAGALSLAFYALMLVGFFLALVAERLSATSASPWSSFPAAMLSMGIALLLLTTGFQLPAAVFTGLAVGISGTRFMLFFINTSHHCQRGTSQSTCFLAWECGIGLGLSLGIVLADGQRLIVAALLVLLSLATYLLLTARWLSGHRNR